MPEKNDREIIDFGLLGALIRHKRQQAGFRRAEDLAAVITELVGYPVSKETLYKVESGRQKPSLELYVSIMRALEPDGDYKFDGLVDMALPNSWSCFLGEEDYDRYAELYPDDREDLAYVKEAARKKKGLIA
ncbi:helix-turn-helix domain-containing protein [Collinsella stercoris]|uniref:HTH cro/C1-type domain-containing protein n=1 Tax=Collinsella stercoris DSM 13279 TaxID=445975 RepID=B6GAL6_9ACTN|nr:helix-turn-helix transcriptional regulator [Collinsella stercoris]EEA90689.1 hypothetical protein COLSTE_01116 [Collinsella stercoris DSM 13279]UEA45492.1 helix-turn-helix domain-containing protein [Collinsella stercoris DSM 13279]UWP11984.1 helix-turn-helix domain-containing protein [Collinsella stercoris]